MFESIMSVISVPVPAYANPPIQDQFYAPSRFVIDQIVMGRTTLVNTTVDMNYVVGQLVRLVIPAPYAAFQLNGKQGYVISLPAADIVEIDIDSDFYDAFNPTPVDDSNVPQILAIGDINSGIISSSGRVIPSTNIPGSFINISPN
jgi:hypothetical protein